MMSLQDVDQFKQQFTPYLENRRRIIPSHKTQRFPPKDVIGYIPRWHRENMWR